MTDIPFSIVAQVGMQWLAYVPACILLGICIGQLVNLVRKHASQPKQEPLDIDWERVLQEVQER